MANASDELAQLLTDLRRDGRQQQGLDPRLVPEDNDAAYDVAMMVAERFGEKIAGWKIAAISPAAQKALGLDAPMYGPVFESEISAAPASFELAGLGTPIPEAEYQVRLGADMPARKTPYVLEDAYAAAESMYPGFEIAECRFAAGDDFPPIPAMLADGAKAGKLIHGAAIDDWREQDIGAQQVTLFADDERRRSGTAAEALGDPLGAVVWLANELSRRGLGLSAGQLISTGAVAILPAPRVGDTLVADFGPFGQPTISFS